MRIWTFALLLLVVVLAGCNSMAIISKPETIPADKVEAIKADAYTEVWAQANAIGLCSLSSGTPFTNTKLLGSVSLLVSSEGNQPVVLPLVPNIAEICSPGKNFQVKQPIPVNPNVVRVSLVITSGFDRQLTDLSKHAAIVASALATGGAAATIKSVAALLATPGMGDLTNDLSQYGGEQIHQFIPIQDPWVSKVIPVFVLEYDGYTSRRKAIQSYTRNDVDRLFEIQIEKRPIFSHFWQNYPNGAKPDRNAVLDTVVQKGIAQTAKGKDDTITLRGYTASRLGDGFNKSDKCKDWQMIASELPYITLDEVLYYHAMLDDGSGQYKPEARVLDNCKLAYPVEEKWREIYPLDWAKVSEFPKNATASEVWKREIAPLLDHASDALTGTSEGQKRARWKTYLESLGTGKKAIEIEGQDPVADVTDENREQVLGALSSLPSDGKSVGCYMPFESNTAGEMYYVVGTPSAPSLWTLQTKKIADGTTATKIKSMSDTDLKNFIAVAYEYESPARCPSIRGLITKYFKNQQAPAVAVSANEQAQATRATP